MPRQASANGATFQLDPDALKAADFMQAQLFIDAIVGKTIASASTDKGRTTISTTDGMTLVFCGFDGGIPAPPKP